MIAEVFPMAVPLYKRDGSIRAHALVDADDYASVMEHRWPGMVDRGKVRVVRCQRGTTYTLARVLLGLPPGRFFEVDHINGDPLDNRRSNLRLTTRSENAQNLQSAYRSSKSGVRGVHQTASGKWTTQVQAAGKKRYLGTYDTIEEAEAVVIAWRRGHMPHSEMDKP